MPFTGTPFLHQQTDLSFQVSHRRNAHDFNSDTFINTMTKENGRAAELRNTSRCRIRWWQVRCDHSQAGRVSWFCLWEL